MTLETITAKIEDKLKTAPSVGAKVKLDFGDYGCVFVDATQIPPVVNNENREADTTLICSMDVFKKIVDGTQDPTMAYMMGKLKIQGSMGLAMKLNSILED
jgi:putative sterol carrier protein